VGDPSVVLLVAGDLGVKADVFVIVPFSSLRSPEYLTTYIFNSTDATTG
jgi:hypothetical protein